MANTLAPYFEEHLRIIRHLSERYTGDLESLGEKVAQGFREGKKVLLMGNGGSAADAQHIAAELVGRFKIERRGLPAIALTTNTSNLTAIANDYDYNYVFQRQIEAFATQGDYVIGISTSGNSLNVLQGIEQARKMGATTIGFCGRQGGKLAGQVDHPFIIPSEDTSVIQVGHIIMGHTLCMKIDQAFTT